MTINANTKIATIIKQHPAALDAIVSISPRFEKLRNPVLRKLMAGRTSLSMATKLGGCTVEDFYNKLQPLGFVADTAKQAETTTTQPLPSFIASLTKDKIVELDVRPILAGGTDPLQVIMEKTKQVKPGEALKIINTFEPTPLILLLQKKGYETYSEEISSNHFETYFYKAGEQKAEPAAAPAMNSDGFEVMADFYKHQLVTVDVRHLEMPQPMMTILEALEQLPEGMALYVYHKRIPVFLLPELNDRNFDYRINEISEDEVHMIIFSN